MTYLEDPEAVRLLLAAADQCATPEQELAVIRGGLLVCLLAELLTPPRRPAALLGELLGPPTEAQPLPPPRTRRRWWSR